MSTEDSKMIVRGEDHWSSRIAFYFAAVGAAVGFGNVWRFPALSYSVGGGAFFIPYLLALFLVGIPLLMLEIAFGQFWQTGDAGVFGHFHRRLTGVGVASVMCGFMVVTYYNLLIAWSINAFFDSFRDDIIWNKANITGTNATDYFFADIIGMSEANDGVGDDKSPTQLMDRNVGYTFLTWFLVFCCLAFGIKWTGRITYFTMGLPIILLFVFLGKSASLEGAEDGIKEYIGIWDTDVLHEQGSCWSTAVSQIFFSLSLTFGIMTAFGAHCPRNDPAFLNSVVIAICNSLFSFISGFAVFGALGHLAYLEGMDMDDENLSKGGFSLVFGTWPVVLGKLPGGIHWVRLLFFDLFLLGMDSAFALVEALLAVIHSSHQFHETPKWKITGTICMIGFLLSLTYATDSGFYFLDVIDYYINFVMILVGFFETFGAGWMYGIEGMINSLGPEIVCSYMFANFGAVIVACGLWFGIENEHAIWAGFVGLVGVYALGIMVTQFFVRKKISEEPDKWTMSSIWWEISFGNIFKLRDLIRPVVGPIPGIWCFFIKQLLPHWLIILFVNLAQSKNKEGKSEFGNYGGYANEPFQVLGILTFVFALFLFLLGVFYPDAYSWVKIATTEVDKGNEAVAEIDAEAIEEVEQEVAKKQKDAEGQDQKPDQEKEEGGSDEEIHT